MATCRSGLQRRAQYFRVHSSHKVEIVCAGKNHICLDAHYVECAFDNSTIITGNWIDGGKQLNVTGADPDLCPKAPALPIPKPWYLWQNGRCECSDIVIMALVFGSAVACEVRLLTHSVFVVFLQRAKLPRGLWTEQESGEWNCGLHEGN